MKTKPRFWTLALAAVLCAAVSSSRAAETESDDQDQNTVPTAAQGDESDEGDAGSEGEKPGAGEADHEGGEEHHGGGEVHDEKDLGHVNVSDKLYDPSEWRFDLAVFTFVVFLLLLGVLMKFAWGPISEGLAAREESVAAKINEAHRDAKAAATRLEEYESKLAGAEAEAQALLAKAQQTADASAARIRQEAEADAEQQKQRARADIEAARGVALDELSNQSVGLAVRLASQIVGRELSQEDHAALIQDALKKFSTSS